MKRKCLVAALFGVVASHASLAPAVELNPDGLGQVLIYPYYTVNAGQSTLLSVANNTALAKVVKVFFREAYNGQEVIDFNLYLSAYDVWTGAVFALSATGPANLLTDDKSCTTPDLRNVTSKLPDGRSYTPFRNFQYAGDSGPSGLERTREGSIEIIEMASIAAGSALEAGVTHAGSTGAPADCSVTATIGIDTPALLTPGGGLYGSGTVVNPAIGTLYAYNADALDGFYTVAGTNLWPISASIGPQLSDTRTTSTTARAYTYAAAGTGGNLAVMSDYASTNAIDAVSAVFAANALTNDYVLEATSGSESEWVLSFPTKRFYVNGAAAPIAPFTNKFSAGKSCVLANDNVWDREGKKVPWDFSVSPPPLALCYQTQVVTFQKAADYTAGNGVSKVLGSVLTTNVDPRANFFTAGRMLLDMASADNRQVLRSSTDGDVYHGLPVTGFMVVNYINGNNGGVLANYSGLYRHKARRD